MFTPLKYNMKLIKNKDEGITQILLQIEEMMNTDLTDYTMPSYSLILLPSYDISLDTHSSILNKIIITHYYNLKIKPERRNEKDIL